LPYGPGFYGGITTKDQFQFSRQEMDVWKKNRGDFTFFMLR
jgi:hypothetical protein